MTSSKAQTAASPPASGLFAEAEYRHKTNRALDAMAQWSLDTKEQAALLGLARVLESHALWREVTEDLLPGNPDLLERCELISLIWMHLELLFPKDPDLARRWMLQPNRAFEGRRPVDLAIEKGPDGLKTIKAYLATAA